MFTEKVLLPPLQTRSAFRLLAVGLVISSWSDYNANQAKEVSASFKTQLLQLLTNDERYEEMALSWTELDSEVSKFESKLKQVVQVLPQLPLENWPVEQLCRQQGNINQGLVKELVEKHEEIVRMTSKIRFDEKMLDVLTKGSLSSSLVGMETLPEKLNPIIKPLMESIKYENNQDILTIVSHKLAKLLHLCILRGNTSASDKVLKNLMFFASNDPKSTPAVRYDHNNVDLGILSLENVSAGNQKTSSAESESHSFVQNQSRGSAKALETIVGHFGEEIREKLPSFHLWTFGRVLASDKTTLQDLTIALRTIEICIPRLSPSCLADVENMLTSFVDLLCHHSAAVRHLSSRCLAVFALQKLLRIPVISAFVEKVLPLLGSEHRHHRQGGVESIYVLINSLGIEIVPYIVLFIIPTLRKMSDQDPHIREIASGAFATLIKLIPLDSSCCSEALPDNLAIKKAEDKKFVEELVNIKNIENYSIDFPVNADLRSYQREGINWLAFLNRYGLHGILCDDMGLGKTLQSICILAGDHMKRRANFSVSGDTDNAPLPSLVICPATVCGHWKAEIEKFVGESILIPAVYSGSSQARQELRYPLKKLALSNDNVVIISSYEIVRNDLTFFCQFHWNYLILDEGHSIRNAKAKTTLAVKSLRANHRLILSGTPIQNSVLELWSLFDFLMPGFLGSERQFSVRYSRPIIASRGTSGTSSNVSKENQEAGALALEALHRQVLPFVLRRVKADVLKDLPPKITQDYYCDLSPLQVMLYEAYAEKQKSAVVKGTEDKRVRSHVFQALQYLRKVCNHPKLVLHPQHDLFPQIEDWLRVNNTTIDDIQNSAKLPALKELLRECNIGTETDENDILNGVVSQHRVLLFCQLKSMMDIVENDLLKRLHNVSYLRLDGSVPTNSRMSIVNRFNTDTSIDIFLLSTSVGGLGLNLTGADTVIFIEHDWNPMKDLQAMDRAHRIGQKKVVNVYRLITRNTLEEKIMGYQKFKLKTANTVISKDNSSLESMGKEQIFELFSLEKSTAAKKKDSGTGFKKFLENLPELWDERQYEDEFRINDEASSSSA